VAQLSIGLGFGGDVLSDGRRLWVPPVGADFAHGRLVLRVETSLSDVVGARELDQLPDGRALPLLILPEGNRQTGRCWLGRRNTFSNGTTLLPASLHEALSSGACAKRA